MNRILFILCILASACTSTVRNSTEKAALKQPNVILIMTDDQGYGDLGFHGNPHVRTPTIDALAKKSIRFNNFFVSPVCAPTRSSLMTGRYSLRTGIHDTYNGGAIMAANEVTIAEMLSDAGYTTGLFGKWHLGDNYPSRPQDQGFHETLHHLGGGIGQPGDWPNFFKKDSSYFDPVLWNRGEMIASNGYCSDVFAEAAVDFISRHKDHPFFVYLSFNAPHDPLQLPEEYYNLYKDIDPASGFENDDRPFPEMDDRQKEIARKVYGMVTNIDDNVKKVLDRLEALDLEENTLVIFMTDNGPWGHRYRAGFRMNKGSVFQGGIKVPSFWSLPSQWEGNQDIGINASHMDVLPTLAALCGGDLPTDRKIDGKNLLPVIEGQTPEWKGREINFYWNRRYPNRYQNMTVIKDDFKLVGQNREHQVESTFELFNLSKDPFEQHDIIATSPDKYDELKSIVDAWYKEMITSPNLMEQQGAIIDPTFENPAVFSRNDAGGQEGVWSASEGVYGLWEVAFAQEGYYDFVFRFDEPINASAGALVKIQMGTILHSVKTSDPELKEFKLENIYVPKIRGQLIPQVILGNWPNQTRILPFVVEVHSKV